MLAVKVANLVFNILQNLIIQVSVFVIAQEPSAAVANHDRLKILDRNVKQISLRLLE